MEIYNFADNSSFKRAFCVSILVLTADVTEGETEEEEECVNSGEDTENNKSGNLEDSDLDEMAQKWENCQMGINWPGNYYFT